MLIKVNKFLLSIGIFFSILSSSALAEELKDRAPYQFTDAGLGNLEITQIVAANNKIYVITSDKLFIKEKTASTFKKYDMSGINPSDHIKNFAVDSDETIYLATENNLLIGNKSLDMLNIHKYSFKIYGNLNAENTLQANSVVLDQKENLYVGTNSGVIGPKVDVRYHYLYPKTIQYSFKKILYPSFQDKLIIDGLYIDTNGLLYAGTNGLGLFIIKQSDAEHAMTSDYACGVECKHFNVSPLDNTLDIKSIYVKNQAIFLGTNHGLYIGKTIYRSDRSSIEDYEFSDAGMHSVLSNMNINSMYVNDAEEWYVGIGGDDNLSGDFPYSLIIGKKQSDDTYSFTPIFKKQLNANSVKTLYVDSEGKIYAGTEHGLYIGTKTAYSDMIYSELRCPETIEIPGNSAVPASIFLSQVSVPTMIVEQSESSEPSSIKVSQTSATTMSPLFGLYFRGIPGGLGGYINPSHEPITLPLLRSLCYGNTPVCDYGRPSNATYGGPNGPGYQIDSSECSVCSHNSDSSLVCGRKSGN